MITQSSTKYMLFTCSVEHPQYSFQERDIDYYRTNDGQVNEKIILL